MRGEKRDLKLKASSVAVENTLAVAGNPERLQLCSRAVLRLDEKLDRKISLPALCRHQWILVTRRACILTHLDFDGLREASIELKVFTSSLHQLVGINKSLAALAQWGRLVTLFADIVVDV